MIEKNTKKVSSSFQENIEYMNQVLPVQESFDVIQRDMLIGGKKASFYFIDGFTKDETMLKIMSSFLGIRRMLCLRTATAFAQQCIPM